MTSPGNSIRGRESTSITVPRWLHGLCGVADTPCPAVLEHIVVLDCSKHIYRPIQPAVERVVCPLAPEGGLDRPMIYFQTNEMKVVLNA